MSPFSISSGASEREMKKLFGLSRLGMAEVPAEWDNMGRGRDYSRLLFKAVDRREQLFERRLPVRQVLILQILHQRFQRRTVLLDAVGPRIAAEEFMDLIDIARQPRH